MTSSKKSINEELDALTKGLEENIKTLQHQKSGGSNKETNKTRLSKPKTEVLTSAKSNKTPIEKVSQRLNIGNTSLLIRNKNSKVNGEWETTNDLVAILQIDTNSNAFKQHAKEYLRGTHIIELYEFLGEAIKQGYIKQLIKQEEDYLKKIKKRA